MAHKDPEKRKAYQKAHYEANKEKIRAQQKAYYEVNKESINAEKKAHYEANKERIKARHKAYYEARSDYYIMKGRKRRQHISENATPAWADMDKVSGIYLKRQEMGSDYHVDHDVPLKGENVCGLHNEFNLVIVAAEDNLSKNNKHDPWTYVHKMPEEE